MRNILNPETPANSENLESTSSLHHAAAGICPKCKCGMGTAEIFSGESVMYCEKCRVAEPQVE